MTFERLSTGNELLNPAQKKMNLNESFDDMAIRSLTIDWEERAGRLAYALYRMAEGDDVGWENLLTEYEYVDENFEWIYTDDE